MNCYTCYLLDLTECLDIKNCEKMIRDKTKKKMILIHITKENREPEVGEWFELNGYFFLRVTSEVNPEGGRPLSLYVRIDVPEDWKQLMDVKATIIIFGCKPYPISNSEEIFQWLHDQGKLGEEWVEWEGDHLFDWDDSVILRSTTCPTPLIRGLNPEYCGICEKDLESETPFGQCLELLRQLADLQNGPPLETYRKEWDNTMTKIYDFLEKHEC